MSSNNSSLFNNFTKLPKSFWIASTEETNYPPLEEDVNVDVAIVGGGMVGITTAWLLKEQGLRVAVIEVDRIIQSTTAHTTAKITSQHTLIYDKIKTQMGEEKAKQYADANESAIAFMANLIKEKNIDCDFSWQKAYVYTQSEEYVQKIMNEVKTASNLGINASYLEELSIPISIKGAMVFENQAQFHPRKYLLTLAKEIPGHGSYIFEETKAVDIEKGAIYKVVTDNGKKVNAEKIILASQYPFYDIRGLYFTRIYTHRSYIVAAKTKEKFPGGMYINAEQPARSLRSLPNKNDELVLFIGEHHKTGQGINTNKHYEALLDFGKELFTIEDIPYHWSTQDCMTMDGVPYIGQHTSLDSNIFVATGFGKWGMTNSTVSAMLLRDLIMKGESPWSPVYNPMRFTPMASAKNFIKENLDVAEKFISGKISPIPEDIDLKLREGKIIKINGRRVGAYKDEDGNLHLVDTTCTHLGCELAWNDGEKSWDCPCHGSRFSYNGDVIEGPTTSPLRRVKIDMD